MAQGKSNVAELPNDRVIVLTRIFDAPCDLVFKVWTQPEHMVQWFGPRDFTAHDVKVDLRQGGAWRVRIRSPEGRDYRMHGVYREIAPPRRLVFTHIWEAGHDSPDHETLITLNFEELDGKTKMIFHKAILESASERASQQNGWSECMQRLNDYLRKLLHLPATVSALGTRSTGRTTTLTHTFNAPRALVFRAWIEPEHILHWFYASEGWTTPFAETDPSPGGRFRIGF